jgi:hypothetical protein
MKQYRVTLAKDEAEALAWFQARQQEGYGLVTKHPLTTTHHDGREAASATVRPVIYLLVEQPEEE